MVARTRGRHVAQKVNGSVWLGPAVVGKAWMHAALLSRGGPAPLHRPLSAPEARDGLWGVVSLAADQESGHF